MVKALDRALHLVWNRAEVDDAMAFLFTFDQCMGGLLADVVLTPGSSERDGCRTHGESGAHEYTPWGDSRSTRPPVRCTLLRYSSLKCTR